MFQSQRRCLERRRRALQRKSRDKPGWRFAASCSGRRRPLPSFTLRQGAPL